MKFLLDKQSARKTLTCKHRPINYSKLEIIAKYIICASGVSSEIVFFQHNTVSKKEDAYTNRGRRKYASL